MTIERVGVDEARALLDADGYVYIDVRSTQEFAQGHPVGAYNIPLQHLAAEGMQDNPDFLQVVQASFAPDTPLILACRSGNRSLRAAELLQAAGYTRLIDLRPGWGGIKDPFGQLEEPGWQASGQPVELDPQPGHDYPSLREATQD